MMPPSPFLNPSASDAAGATAAAHCPSIAPAAAVPNSASEVLPPVDQAAASAHRAHPAHPARPAHAAAEPLPQEGQQEAPAVTVAPTAAGATDCISEIFHYARKLIAEDRCLAEDEHRFVLDVDAFMAEVEEPPLFLRKYRALR